MAGTLTFPIAAIAAIARHAVEAREHSHGYDVLFDPAFHKGGKVVEKDGWPDKDNIDKAKLRPALELVKDQGVYVMSNGLPALPVGDGSNVAYAEEANPKKLAFDTWWDNARRIMGGDDTVITLFGFPEAVLKAEKDGAAAIKLKVTSRAVSLEAVWPRRAPAASGRKRPR